MQKELKSSEKCVQNRMSDLKLDITNIPFDDYKELKSKFKMLENDFLYNLRVVDEKEKIIQYLQQTNDALHIQIKKKESEFSEIKKECEHLRNAQEDLFTTCNNLRKSVIISSTAEHSIENRKEQSKETIPAVEENLLEKVDLLDKQLKNVNQENFNLNNQILNLKQKYMKATSVLKHEIQEYKTTQTTLSQQHQDSIKQNELLKEENLKLNSEIKQIVTLIDASSRALNLKEINNFQQSCPLSGTDKLMKTFVKEIFNTINQYRKHMQQSEFFSKSKNDNFLQQCKEKEEELKHLRQQNLILMKIIKERKQFSETHFAPPTQACTKKGAEELKEELKGEEILRALHETSDHSPKQILHCNAENILISLSKRIENLLQMTDTDKESELEIQKVEENLRSLKSHLLHHLQQKIDEIHKGKNNLGKCKSKNAEMLLAKEEINKVSANVISETNPGQYLLLQTLQDIRDKLSCQSPSIKESEKPNAEKQHQETSFEGKSENERWKMLESKVQELESFIYRKIQFQKKKKSQTADNYSQSNSTKSFFEKWLSSSDQIYSSTRNKFPVNDIECNHNCPSQELFNFKNNCPNNHRINQFTSSNECEDVSHIDSIWFDLNENYSKHFLT